MKRNLLLSVAFLFLIFSACGCSHEGKIAFLSDRDGTDGIYVMNADGSDPVKLINNGAGNLEPVWSPDGKRIAYTVTDGFPPRINLYVIDADGGSPINLTNNSAANMFPVWSPDGKQIAYVSYVSSSHSVNIYVINAGGGSPIHLTNNGFYNFDPAWSPNGKKIAFASNRDSNTNIDTYEMISDIYVMNADGSNPVNLTNNDAYNHEPVWSPNGKKIAFVVAGQDSDVSDFNIFTSNPDIFAFHSNIYVMDADGGNPINLTNSSDENSGPVWSPDGRKIAFVSSRDGFNEIYVMDANGRNLIRLTNKEFANWGPVWSPDGKKIAFVSNHGTNFEICVVDADGSNLINLTNNDANDSSPTWLP